MATIYHVARNGWEDGDPIMPLSVQRDRGFLTDDQACEIVAKNWPSYADCPGDYLCGDGYEIHCWDSPAKAQEFAAQAEVPRGRLLSERKKK